MTHGDIVDPLDEIRILHVDDDVNQGEFLQYFLPKMDKAFRIDFVSEPSQVMEKMNSNRYDCIVTDYKMPEINGIELAWKIRKSFDLPIIIYTGQGSEEIAEEAFSAGIDDYLRKEMDPSHYQVLAKRIRNAVDKNRLDVMYKTIIEETNEAIIISVGNKIEFANNAALDMLNIDNVSDLEGDQYRFLKNEKTNKTLLNNQIMSEYSDQIISKHTLKLKNDRNIIVDASSGPITYNGKNGLITFLRDITRNEQLEKEKRESQERFQALFELSPVGIMTFDLKGIITSINPAFEHLTGYTSDEFIGKHFLAMKTLRKTDLRNFLSMFSNILKGKNPPPFEFRYLRSDGTQSWGESHTALINISGKREFLIIAQDISERKKQKEEASVQINREYKDSSINDDLLISIGHLGYLLSDQVLSNIKDIDEKMKFSFSDPNIYEESVEEVNNILKQTLVLLDEYKKITEETLSISKDTIIDIILKIIEPIKESNNIKLNINKIDQMFASFDIDVLDRVLNTLLNEILVKSDHMIEIDLSINVTTHFVEIIFENMRNNNGKNINKNMITYLNDNPEIKLIREYLKDNGGQILLNDKDILKIDIPLIKKEIQSQKILERIRNVNYNQNT